MMMKREGKTKQDTPRGVFMLIYKSILRKIDRVITATHFRHNAHLKSSTVVHFGAGIIRTLALLRAGSLCAPTSTRACSSTSTGTSIAR